MNPCPCGYATDPGRTCTCPAMAVERYLSRLSGPLLDRIDIQVDVPAVAHRELASDRAGEPSEAIRERVERARAIQAERFRADEAAHANAHMRPRDLKTHCRTSAAAAALLARAVARLKLSARGYHRVLKIARTIADLAGAAAIDDAHVSEAIQFRSLDRGRG